MQGFNANFQSKTGKKVQSIAAERMPWGEGWLKTPHSSPRGLAVNAPHKPQWAGKDSLQIQTTSSVELSTTVRAHTRCCARS